MSEEKSHVAHTVEHRLAKLAHAAVAAFEAAGDSGWKRRVVFDE